MRGTRLLTQNRMRLARGDDHDVLGDDDRPSSSSSAAPPNEITRSRSPPLSDGVSTSSCAMTVLSETSWVSASSARHTGRQQELRGGRHDADPDVPRVAAREVDHLARGLVRGDVQTAGPREQCLARGREPDAATRALEQLRAEHFLQPPHAARERGLREMELLGGAAEMSELGDRFEVTKVAQVELYRHGYGLPRSSITLRSIE